MSQMDSAEGLLSILMPVYNERAYLRRCVENVLAAPLPGTMQRELVIVNDASTDNTGALIDELAAKHPDTIRAFHQPVNQGKGAAIRRAIQEMRGDYAIVQDADLEYDPNEYPVVLRPIIEGHADVSYGSRFASSSMRKVLNYHHSLGNMFLTHLSNMFTGLNLTDMETCYKAFRADVLKTIPLRSNRFGIEPEVTAKIAKRGCSVYEVPISYHGRSYAEGKKIGWKDGVSAIWTILKYWLIDDCYEERYGHGVLHTISGARRFVKWMVNVIEPYIGSRVLEVGSGIGNMSRLLPQKEQLTVSDVDDQYLEILEDIYRDNDLVSVAQLDLNSDGDFAALPASPYDTVVCLNVLEHIEDEKAALERIRKTLSPGGRLILLVPQYPALYGAFDRELEHFRRYTRKGVVNLLATAGFKPVTTMNFNFLSIMGWWMSSVVLKKKSMSKWQIKLFDMLVPILQPIESMLPLPGLSLICVAEV